MIYIQFYKQKNSLINEDLVRPNIVNMQTVDFNDWCVRMAKGSTVTAADVAAVMQQIEDKLPDILSLNAKVICSPGGLCFRPKVSGSITQSELKKKLEEKKAAETDPEKAARINVNRALTTSDLTIGDCTVSIAVDLPKDWSSTFKNRAELKRVRSAGETGSTEEEESGTTEGGGSNSNPSNPTSSVAAPTISGQTPFANTSEVTLSAENGASVYYTVDGSTPTAESTPYSAPFTLNSTTVVKAIAIKDGVSSEVATKNFTKSSGDQDD